MADKFDKGSELELKIFIPDQENPVYARSKVAWQSKCDYVPNSKRHYYVTGIQFSNMSNEDAIKTSDFVRDILEKQSTGKNKTIVDMLENLHSK